MKYDWGGGKGWRESRKYEPDHRWRQGRKQVSQHWDWLLGAEEVPGSGRLQLPLLRNLSVCSRSRLERCTRRRGKLPMKKKIVKISGYHIYFYLKDRTYLSRKKIRKETEYGEKRQVILFPRLSSLIAIAALIINLKINYLLLTQDRKVRSGSKILVFQKLTCYFRTSR